MNAKRFLAIVCLLTLTLALASPAYAQGSGGPGMVSFGRDINVGPGEVVTGDVVAFGGNITVQTGARISGSVVAFGGNIRSAGEIGRSAVSFGANVSLESGSLVREDAVAIGGNVSQAEGARVLGNVSSGSTFPLSNRPPAAGYYWSPFDWPAAGSGNWGGSVLGSMILNTIRAVITILLLTALAAVIAAVFPKHLDTVRDTMAAQPAGSAGIGCLGFLVAAAISVPLVITCIGPFILWAIIAAACVLGIAAAGLWLGEQLTRSMTRSSTPLVSATVGTAVLVLLLSLADAVPCLSCFGWLFWLIVASMAFGAVILSRGGTVFPTGNASTPAVASAPPATSLPERAPGAEPSPPDASPQSPPPGGVTPV